MARWLWLVVAWLGLALPGLAQVLAFDAVSIKPHEGSDGSVSVRTTSDRYSASGVSVAGLIVYAYGIEMEDVVVGLPGPLKSARFDIEAKIDVETVEALKHLEGEQRADKRRAMMKAVLEERFKLKIHFEKKEMSIYSLVVAKGGSKMKQASGGDGLEHHHTSIHNGTMEAQGVTMSSLSKSLEGQVHRVVRDDTGLAGTYDLTMQWARDDPAESNAEVSAPSLFTALQEQLGLRLESAKGPVDSVVVDHVEMPSEN